MSREIPIYDMQGQYASTLDMDLAMLNDYIGEVVIRPKVLDEAIGLITGRRLFTGTVFYYGTPDEELRQKFYYKPMVNRRK